MEKPNWERGDGLKSLKDIGSLVLDTIADLLPLDCTIVLDEQYVPPKD